MINILIFSSINIIIIVFLFVDEKYSVLFHLIHAIFIPTTKKVTKDEIGKTILLDRYSIKDGHNCFMVFKNSIPEIEEYIMLCNENIPIQPFILNCGTPNKPKEIIVLNINFFQ